MCVAQSKQAVCVARASNGLAVTTSSHQQRAWTWGGNNFVLAGAVVLVPRRFRCRSLAQHPPDLAW